MSFIPSTLAAAADSRAENFASFDTSGLDEPGGVDPDRNVNEQPDVHS